MGNWEGTWADAHFLKTVRSCGRGRELGILSRYQTGEGLRQHVARCQHIERSFGEASQFLPLNPTLPSSETRASMESAAKKGGRPTSVLQIGNLRGARA